MMSRKVSVLEPAFSQIRLDQSSSKCELFQGKYYFQFIVQLIFFVVPVVVFSQWPHG